MARLPINSVVVGIQCLAYVVVDMGILPDMLGSSIIVWSRHPIDRLAMGIGIPYDPASFSSPDLWL